MAIPAKAIHLTIRKRIQAGKVDEIAEYISMSEYCKLQDKLKVKDEALKIAVDTFTACFAEEDDPKYKGFNIDDLVMAGQICSKALKGE